MHGQPAVWFDYTRQAWVEHGRYVACAHPASMNCRCYGRAHAGEQAPVEEYQRQVAIDAEYRASLS